MPGDPVAVPRLIGLVGPSGSGKDEVARILGRRWGFVRVAVADPIKEATAVIFDLDREHLWGSRKNEVVVRIGMTSREAFQRVGDGLRAVEPGLWLTLFVRRVLEAQRTGQRVVCPDVRTHDEVAAIGSLGGQVWRVVRPGAGAPGKAGKHETETDLAGLPDGRFGVVVRNDGGLSDLDERCADLLARQAPAATPTCYIGGRFQ
jgi:hypothetical protein